MMHKDKEFSWFKLVNAPGFGPKTIHYIYEEMQKLNMTVNDLFEIEPNKLSEIFPNIGKGKFNRANFSSFQKLNADDNLYKTFEKLKSDGVSIITLDDERYPKFVLQKMKDDAPPVLYCKGYLPLLNTEGVAVIGSRNVNDYEVEITKNFAKKLAENGFNVISGYAKGVDTSAHLGALEANGTTTMVLKFGINHLTIKKEFQNLDWKRNALFVTQFAPDEKFLERNAMIRNKLICAMSKVVIVIKSGPKKDDSGKWSGTFNAAEAALDMGIPVFVLRSQSVQSPGNVDLIHLGAKEFSDLEEVIDFLKKPSERETEFEKEQSNKKGIKESTNSVQQDLFTQNYKEHINQKR